MKVTNNFNDIGKCSRDDLHTLKHDDLLDAQLAITRKIVSELRDFDNFF